MKTLNSVSLFVITIGIFIVVEDRPHDNEHTNKTEHTYKSLKKRESLCIIPLQDQNKETYKTNKTPPIPIPKPYKQSNNPYVSPIGRFL